MTIKFVRKTTYFDRLVFVVNKFFFFTKKQCYQKTVHVSSVNVSKRFKHRCKIMKIVIYFLCFVLDCFKVLLNF